MKVDKAPADQAEGRFAKSTPAFLLLLALSTSAFGAQPIPAEQSGGSKVFACDLLVYGGTSGGVVAAVQAVRMGKRVVLLEPGKHVGGMTSGGLSAVDIGDPRTVGGIAREYFTRLVARYGRRLAWDQPFKSRGGPATGGAYSIEPHVAETVFTEMLEEAGLTVRFDQQLVSLKKNGSRITELTTNTGRTYSAKMFIDATYEGDLMAQAGVSFTLKREANRRYHETLNGVQFVERYTPVAEWGKPGVNGRRPDGKGIWDRDLPIDPYVIRGNPASGLLPLVEAMEPAAISDEAPGVQAYCYRLCLTDRPENRIPLAEPPGYQAKRYELVARFIEACLAAGDEMDLRWFSKYDPVPNGKFDFNTATFGGNLPGASWAWAEADTAGRARIAREHQRYHRGLLWFLASDSRVPARVREEMNRLGFCRDEFRDTGGWPHQLYIREARRMVSDLVMTQHHCQGREKAPKSVGLASYGIDIHEIRRVVHDGIVWREGKLGGRVTGPYPIGYAAMVPRESECGNLFVPLALSASHVAFGSIRMEPVFMVLSQSSATAACLAIDAGISVQQLDYARLRERLLADRQVLE